MKDNNISTIGGSLMSRPSHFSHFSIDMTSDGLYYVCVGHTPISYFFKDKQTCREFCTAVDRSFNRLQTRYSMIDYRLSLSPKGGSEPGAS